MFFKLSPLQKKAHFHQSIYEIFRDYCAENGDHKENTISGTCSYKENFIPTYNKKKILQIYVTDLAL